MADLLQVADGELERENPLAECGGERGVNEMACSGHPTIQNPTIHHATSNHPTSQKNSRN
jgi:hypothetical protein